MLRTVLKSDRLVLLSARGNVVPGILREVRVAAIIEQYLSRHPDQSMEQFLPCLKIWDMDTFVELAGAGAGAGISPETVAIVQSSFAAFQTSICRHLQGEDVVTFYPRTLRITPQDSYSRRPPALRPVVRPPRPEHRAHHGAGPAPPRLRHSPGTVV